MRKSNNRSFDSATNRHHTHKHHTVDASEEFKNRSFLSIKRRKAIAKFLYVAMCIAATLIIIACILSFFA